MGCRNPAGRQTWVNSSWVALTVSSHASGGGGKTLLVPACGLAGLLVCADVPLLKALNVCSCAGAGEASQGY